MSVVWFRAARGVSQFVLNIATRIGTVTAKCLFKRICRIWGSNKLADAMTVLNVFFLLCGAYEIHTIRKVGKTTIFKINKNYLCLKVSEKNVCL